LYINSA